jgi:putative transposase
VAGRCVELLRGLVPALGGSIIELVVRPDHVHRCGHFPPALAPYQSAHRVKGATSHTLREAFPALKSRRPSLRTHSYYCGTTGAVSSETGRKYLEAPKGLCVRKRFKYRAYPTKAQAAAMAALVGTHRHRYNRALAERQDAREQERRGISSGDRSAT